MSEFRSRSFMSVDLALLSSVSVTSVIRVNRQVVARVTPTQSFS